jgi:hypothetical protein
MASSDAIAADGDLNLRLSLAREAREYTAAAQEAERVAVTKFIELARFANWSWQKIGDSLGITDTAARAYYSRNIERAAQ